MIHILKKKFSASSVRIENLDTPSSDLPNLDIPSVCFMTEGIIIPEKKNPVKESKKKEEVPSISNDNRILSQKVSLFLYKKIIAVLHDDPIFQNNENYRLKYAFSLATGDPSSVRLLYSASGFGKMPCYKSEILHILNAKEQNVISPILSFRFFQEPVLRGYLENSPRELLITVRIPANFKNPDFCFEFLITSTTCSKKRSSAICDPGHSI